jgi:hypothetical protein
MPLHPWRLVLASIEPSAGMKGSVPKWSRGRDLEAPYLMKTIVLPASAAVDSRKALALVSSWR